MRIVIAGGAGFIGSNLTERLLAAGHSVICIDNFATGRPSNVEPFLREAAFELIPHDIIEPLPPLPPVDRVYHLASPASPPGYVRLPIETMRANSEGTRHLLDLSVRNGATFVYCSTSEVYGDSLEHPQTEAYRGNVSTTGPRSVYDESKRFGEALVAAYHRRFDADVRIARIFNTYGPRSAPDDGRLVPNFVVAALRDKPITVYGDGTQTRSLCYVSDLVEGLIAMAESDAAGGEVVNLGNPDEHTILEFAELVRELTGSRSEIVFRDYAVADDPRRRQPDITKARRLLGWEPIVGLREGLTRTIDYFRAELGLAMSAEGRSRL
ncbi:MAG TPA: UDP-glucuronic acid decarboxylase family protein [Dehalococcoidia bacterium]|nr:UDP-glucuronic acid decarboxylase family protein [Dehalococcoidia bacterium]